MLGAEGGGEMGGEGVEAGGELLYPLLQGQHLALQVLTAVVELRHELIHDALHLRRRGEERRGEVRRGEERRGEERRGEERRGEERRGEERRGEERKGDERRGEERRGEERRGEERRGDDSVHTEYFEEGKQIANT